MLLKMFLFFYIPSLCSYKSCSYKKSVHITFKIQFQSVLHFQVFLTLINMGGRVIMPMHRKIAISLKQNIHWTLDQSVNSTRQQQQY